MNAVKNISSEQNWIILAPSEQNLLIKAVDSAKWNTNAILWLNETEKNAIVNNIHKLLLEIDVDKLKWFRLIADEIQSDWNLNIACVKWWTLLMYAAEYQCLSLIKLLMAKWADSSIKNEKWETALEIAKKHHNYKITDFLIESIK
jgi:hypothetical protein